MVILVIIITSLRNIITGLKLGLKPQSIHMYEYLERECMNESKSLRKPHTTQIHLL